MRLKMTKAEVSEHVRRRADEMAMSGDHEDFMSIEMALDIEGFPEVRELLDVRVVRWKLNRACNRARRQRGLPLSVLAADGDEPFAP